MEHTDANDHEVMLAVRAGHTKRLGELFERYHRPLYGFFVKLTRRPDASEDLVQQVFYRMLKYRHTYRGDGKFTSWMYFLARKVAADFFRQHQRDRAQPPSEDGLMDEVADQAPPPADVAASRDEHELLRRALARLPLEQREALTLFRFHHLRHDEIAQVQECSVGAVKVRVHRGLQALREIFLKLQEENPTPRS